MTSSHDHDASNFDQLVDRARTDRQAFAALYDRYFPLVHRYCRRRLSHCAAADDVASEAFLQAARGMPAFPGTTDEAFRRWVYRIATNAIHAHQRRESRRGRLLRQASDLGRWNRPDAASESNHREHPQWEAVEHALATLKERERTVLTLRYLEGLSYDDVARILNIRPATLRVVVNRALKNLRALLPEDFETTQINEPSKSP